MDTLRKVQKIGYSTLSVSIPASYAKEAGLEPGTTVLLRDDVDGTLRLIPSGRVKRVSKASIKADALTSEELLSRLIIGCYALGYDTIELVSKERLKTSLVDIARNTVKRLRGLETVESETDRLVAQSFMDPTKFPVDSLVKRLQLLVSRSLEHAIAALRSTGPGLLNEVRRLQEEIDELYWLVVRQLLVSLNNSEIANEIGIESPLHASGDRVSAKTLDEIGRLVLDMTEEIIRLKELRTTIEERALKNIEILAEKVQASFSLTVQGLLAPEVGLIERATQSVDEALTLEKVITHELLESAEYAYSRTIISYLGQVARYCNIIIEISLNRLLRKTSKVVIIQVQ
jgi:phosphate uptake regulator